MLQDVREQQALLAAKRSSRVAHTRTPQHALQHLGCLRMPRMVQRHASTIRWMHHPTIPRTHMMLCSDSTGGGVPLFCHLRLSLERLYRDSLSTVAALRSQEQQHADEVRTLHQTITEQSQEVLECTVSVVGFTALYEKCPCCVVL